jgi:hypothetical protein
LLTTNFRTTEYNDVQLDLSDPESIKAFTRKEVQLRTERFNTYLGFVEGISGPRIPLLEWIDDKLSTMAI